MLCMKWIDLIDESWASRTTKKDKEIINTSKIRKLQYVDYVRRGETYALDYR